MSSKVTQYMCEEQIQLYVFLLKNFHNAVNIPASQAAGGKITQNKIF